MRVGMLVDRRRIEVREREVPPVGSDDVLIRVAWAGVCGSDVHAFEGRHPFREPPVVLGHELVGTIVGLGENVSVLQRGDRVTVMPVVGCGECELCRAGRSNICHRKVVPGTESWLGTFADYVVAPASVTYRLGENTSLDLGVLAEPLAVAAHSVRQARVAPGDRVLILGAGTIGLLTLSAAIQAGAAEVVVTDVQTYNLCLAVELGATAAYDARDDILEQMRADGYGLFDAAFITGGGASTVTQALALAKRGARIVVTAMIMEPVPVDLLTVTLGELEVLGSQIYTDEDFRAALSWLDRHSFAYERIVTHRFSLDQAQEAVMLLAERRDRPIKVLLEA